MKKKISVIDGKKHLMVQNEAGEWIDKGLASDEDIEELEGNVEDITKQVKGVVSEALKEHKKGIDASIETVSQQVADISEKVTAIEKLPFGGAQQKSFGSEVYKGYELAYQGARIREKIAGRKSLYPVLSDESNFREMCKWFIDASKALARKDFHNEALSKAPNIEGDNEFGGYTVPIEYQWELIQLARESSVIMQLARLIQMSSNKLLLPKEQQLVTVTPVAEAGTITASQPKWAQVVLEAVKFAGLTEPISNELLSDSAFDISSLLIEQFMYAFSMAIEDAALNGVTGFPQFVGLLASINTNIISLDAGKTKYTDVDANTFSEMIDLLSDKDRESAIYVFNKRLNHTVRTLKDTTGNYIYAKPGEVGQPNTIWGYDMKNSPKMPFNSAAVANSKFAIFGNFSNYLIGIRKGQFTLDVDPFTGFANDTVRFRCVMRVAGNVAREDAFSAAKTAAS